MNDTSTQDALKEIFDELSYEDGEMGVGEELFESFDDPEGAEALKDFVGGGDFGADDVDADMSSFTGMSSFDEEGIFDTGALPGEEEVVEDVGPSWAAVVFGIVMVLSFAGWLFLQYQDNQFEQQRISQTADAAAAEANIKEVGHQALRALNGDEQAFTRLSELKTDTERLVSRLRSGDAENNIEPIPDSALDELESITDNWALLLPQIDVVLNNRTVIRNTLDEVAAVNALSPELLLKTDELVQNLIDSGASLELINIASRQRFLTQRIKASMNEFAIGAPGWEVAATQFGRDVKQFGQVNNAIGNMGGQPVAGNVAEVKQLHSSLMQSSDGVMNNVGDYFSMRAAANTVTEMSQNMDQLTNSFRQALQQEEQTEVQRLLPLVLGVIALLSLLFMVVSILRNARKRDEANEKRTKIAEDAVIKLLDEMGDLAQGDLRVQAEVTNEVTGAIADSINFAVGEMRVLVNGIKLASNEMTGTTEGTEQLIADLLTSNGAQSEEIASASSEVENMTTAINRMTESASQSSDRARETAEAAKQGADAVRNTIRGMDTTRTQIQETAKRLKRLGESSQQINEIVDLIQDVTEQTNVLSINASIQAAMAGEAGRGFAVVAEEVQRLADRSARASNEITELVKNIQQDTNNAIASMEITTEEVVSGATMADEAGRLLGRIEAASQELLDNIDAVASEAKNESEVAKTVSERMETLRSATEKSDLSVSQVAVALEQMKEVTERLDRSVAGFTLPAGGGA